VAHLDLANEPFQLIIRAGQACHVVARKQSPPKAAKDLVDVRRDTLVFGVMRAASGQVNQVAIHRLCDTGAAFGRIAFWVE